MKYTTKEQEDSFLQHREELIQALLTRSVKNGVKVAIIHCGNRFIKDIGTYYSLDGIRLRLDCNKGQYSYARKSLNKKIKIQRVAKLAKELREVRKIYHDGQDIIQDAILASRRNY